MEEYHVETKDGYWLALHRLLPSPQTNHRKSESAKKPVVLLWHGFMMNSEVWLAHPAGNEGNLAIHLVEQGFVSILFHIQTYTNH